MSDRPAMILDPTGKTLASIHLDYGADSADFDFEDLYICPRGLRMKTRWSFAPGAELSVNFQLADAAPLASARLLKTQGVVVDCDPSDDGDGFQVTLVFLEVTEDILTVIRDLAEDGSSAMA